MEQILGGLRRRIALTAELVAFPHTIFALPFALMGMMLGANGSPGAWRLLWILTAMIGARSAAMSFNRIADRRFDAANPRTSGRPLPSGRLGMGWAVMVLMASTALFVASAWMLNPLCFVLSPLALAIVLSYSYMKRFTWLTHIMLGLSLAVAVLCWTAGFDIIYACQDVGFDRSQGLKSIPARFGVTTALHMSSLLHVVMILSLAVMGVLAGMGLIFLFGLGLTSVFLIHEHRLVTPGDLSKINLAFFTMNGWTSVVLCVATMLDLIVS